jgi:hypothetical protein
MITAILQADYASDVICRNDPFCSIIWGPWCGKHRADHVITGYLSGKFGSLEQDIPIPRLQMTDPLPPVELKHVPMMAP